MLCITLVSLAILRFGLCQNPFTNVETEHIRNNGHLELAVAAAKDYYDFSKIQEELKNKTIYPTLSLAQPSIVFPPDPYDNLGPVGIIEFNNYPAEVHTVVTNDGYLLQVFRIPFGKRTPQMHRGPVLLMHGSFTAGDIWLLAPSDRALPFVLADEGYDVWLGNFRATDFTTHFEYNKNQLEFWKYDMEDMGTRDVPATIDYILRETGREQLHFIGFSLGCGAVNILLSLMPEYNAKIKQMVLMAPVGYMYHADSALKYLRWVPDRMFLKQVDRLGHGKISLGEVSLVSKLLTPETCDAGTTLPRPITCPIYFLSITGFFTKEANLTTQRRGQPRFQGISARIITHYTQLFRHNSFKRMDYGPEENLERYGTPIAGEYDLSKNVVPTLGLYAPGDVIINPTDAKRTLSELGNLVNPKSTAVNHSTFSHIDFQAHDLAKTLAYDRIVNFLNNYATHPDHEY